MFRPTVSRTLYYCYYLVVRSILIRILNFCNYVTNSLHEFDNPSCVDLFSSSISLDKSGIHLCMYQLTNVLLSVLNIAF